MNAGPTLTNAFHVIGTMFNTYADGNPANVVWGDQTYNIPPGGGAMFELRFPTRACTRSSPTRSPTRAWGRSA